MARQTDQASDGAAGPETTVVAPGVRVDTNEANGETTVKAPYTQVEKDDQGTRVKAPGVEVEIPRTPKE